MNLTYIRQNGFKINIRVDKGYQDVKVINEVISGDEYRIEELASVLKDSPPKVILDIGGHIGCFGLLAKRYWPDAKLIAVEPFEDNVTLYRMNMKDNFPGTTFNIVKKAISYTPGRNCLTIASRTTGGGTVLDRQTAEQYVRERYKEFNDLCQVETITIEELLSKFKIDRVDITKWDCEGGEADAFYNMKPYTAKKFVFMMGEVHIPAPGRRYLDDKNKPNTLDCRMFWRKVQRKFSHLIFDFISNERTFMPLCNFRAWPKEISDVTAKRNTVRCAG